MSRLFAKLYKSSRWQHLRRAQLSEHPLCRMHADLGRVEVATVVDHIKAHKGDTERFFDRSNLQSLCKACHDSHKQAQEHNTDGILRGAGLNGQPLDLSHPWHSAGQGGVKNSQPPTPGTGRVPPLAMCHNSEGGA